MRYFSSVLVCFCLLGWVTLAVSQGDEENNVISDFGRRVITNVRGGNRRRSIMTESPLVDIQERNIKEPADQMALEQQYYIEPVTPSTTTVRPTFRRRKTQRPITSLAKKKEGPSEGSNDGNIAPQEHFNPFKQVVNTSFSKRRPSVGRTRARAPTNEISSTTEGQDQKSKIRFSVSQEIDHNNEGNNPSAFGLRGQAFRGDDAADDKPRFRPSQPGKSPFRPSRVSTTTKRSFTAGNAESDKSPLEITYENETSGVANQHAGRRKFILRPRQNQGNGRPSAFVASTTAETPLRAQRKRKRPGFLQDSENLESNSPAVITFPDNVPRARSIDGGRRRKTTSFTPPTQRFSASELVVNAELLPSPSPFVLVSVSPLNSENRNQLRMRPNKPALKINSGDFEFLKATTGYTTDSSATISTYPTTVVTEIDNVLIADSEPIIILPPVLSTLKPAKHVKHIPGRNRINERLRFRDRSVNPTPGVPALQASASTTVQVVSPSPQAPTDSQETAKQSLFPTRQSLFDKLSRKQSTLRLLAPKPKAEKPEAEKETTVEIKSAPPQKITSLTQQNLKRRIPGRGGLLNKKLQKEIASENPPEGENVSSEVSEEQQQQPEKAPEASQLVAPPPVGIRNLTSRRRPLSMRQKLTATPVTESGKETPVDQEAVAAVPNSEETVDTPNEETPVAPLSKVRKLPTRAPLLHRLVITTAAPSSPPDDTTVVTCSPNQRYSKFLKRCVTQYNPAKNLGLH